MKFLKGCAHSKQGRLLRRRRRWPWLPLALCLLLGLSAFGQKLSPLAPPPDWRLLEKFQGTMTREEFSALLANVYAPNGAARDFIEIQPTRALIRKTLSPMETFELRFAAAPQPVSPPVRPEATPWQPLRNLHIALDPGHIGGEWAQMEERWFRIGDSKPVMEGEMTLLVAELLAARLRELGAKVSLVRGENRPVTPARPQTFVEKARADLVAGGAWDIREHYAGFNDPARHNTVQWQAEKLFYRISEIRTRADIVNEKLKPDLTVCLHFDAAEWGDPLNPQLVEANHLHVLVNGNYAPDELTFDDIRLEMLLKLLSRSFPPEVAMSESVAQHLAAATRLPPYVYTGPNARRISGNPYVWARNLLANRLYRCPVVYIEPYVMNSREVFERVQLGDYEGERLINGVMRRSIFREYALAVAEGLAAHFRQP
jgi:hypothetical protein